MFQEGFTIQWWRATLKAGVTADLDPPGPNPLADMDPPFADLDPTKLSL